MRDRNCESEANVRERSSLPVSACWQEEVDPKENNPYVRVQLRTAKGILHHAPRVGPYCREMATLPERRMYFWTLPVAVLGS